MRNLQNKKYANIFNFQELQQNLFLIILILSDYIFAKDTTQNIQFLCSIIFYFDLDLVVPFCIIM